MSTTFRPSWWTHSAAPTSCPASKLAAKASLTGSKPGSTRPVTPVDVDGTVQAASACAALPMRKRKLST